MQPGAQRMKTVLLPGMTKAVVVILGSPLAKIRLHLRHFARFVGARSIRYVLGLLRNGITVTAANIGCLLRHLYIAGIPAYNAPTGHRETRGNGICHAAQAHGIRRGGFADEGGHSEDRTEWSRGASACGRDRHTGRNLTLADSVWRVPAKGEIRVTARLQRWEQWCRTVRGYEEVWPVGRWERRKGW